MKPLLRLLLLAGMLTTGLPAEEIIPGIVNYDPPEFLDKVMTSPAPADDHPGQWVPIREYLANDNRPTLQHRQVNFSVHLTKAADADIPRLMQQSSKNHDGKPRMPEPAQVGGRQGWKITYDSPVPSFREGAISRNATIWVRIRPGQIFEATLTAIGPELIQSLEQSLATLKITPDFSPPPPLRLTITARTPLLGMIRADVRAGCGEPLFQDSNEDLYYDGRYFLHATYRMPLLESLIYHRVSDGIPFLEATKKYDRNGLKMFLPLSDEELAALLKRNTTTLEGKASSWEQPKPHEWRRADGATARYDAAAKFLIITRPASE